MAISILQRREAIKLVKGKNAQSKAKHHSLSHWEGLKFVLFVKNKKKINI
jgi:hypothetical protein